MLRTLNRLLYGVSHRFSSKTKPSSKKKTLGLVEVDIPKMTPPLVYQSVDTILEVFNDDEHKYVNGAKELLKIYDNTVEQKSKHEALGEVKKYPLIVLEGLDGSGKSTVGKRVAKKFEALQWRTPPDSISHLRNLFDNNPALRTAFYSLGNYIAALEVQLLLKSQPVIMDRFWHSTAAYALAQSIQDYPDKHTMPPAGDKIYSWPNDLFKPDIVLLLNVSEEVRLERHSRRKTVTAQEDLLKSSTTFRQNVLQAYKNMRNPGVEYVNGDYSFGSVLGQIQRKTEHLFQ